MPRNVFTLLIVAGSVGPSAADQPGPRTTAPVEYNGSVLVVATDAGVAAFEFTERVDRGTTYKFRFRPAKDGTEETGSGKVFERYKAVQGRNANDVTYVYDGGDLWLTAGPVKVEWSRGGVDNGWLYFDAAKVQVQAVKGTEFDKLDLKKFAR